jgi:hypothetical protein
MLHAAATLDAKPLKRMCPGPRGVALPRTSASPTGGRLPCRRSGRSTSRVHRACLALAAVRQQVVIIQDSILFGRQVVHACTNLV